MEETKRELHGMRAPREKVVMCVIKNQGGRDEILYTVGVLKTRSRSIKTCDYLVLVGLTIIIIILILSPTRADSSALQQRLIYFGDFIALN